MSATTKVEKVALSVEEAAEYIGGIDTSTMFRILWEKKIPTYKVGRRRFVTIQDLDNYISDNKEG